MNQPDKDTPAAANPCDATPSPPANPQSEGTENYYSGSEPFFTFFTQAQVLLGALRLTLDGRVIVSTSDLGTQMETARRGFQHSGNLTVAVQDVGRISAMFGQRVQAWEREVQALLRNKREMSGGLIQRWKSEIARIRGQVQSNDRALTKLKVKLHQMSSNS